MGYSPWGGKESDMTECTRDESTRGHHQMVNTKIRLIIFFAAKDGEALYSQQKQLSSRGRGRLRGFLELRRPWGETPILWPPHAKSWKRP